ncbi:Uncharacterised protein [Streptococcus pneumoniae]|nr:Uncharacterised protein [Streptococcus pneumoniae]
MSVTVSFVFLPFFATVRLSFVKEACPSSVSFTIRGTLLKGNYILEMRKNNEFLDQSAADDWTLGYAFYIEEVDEEKANT